MIFAKQKNLALILVLVLLAALFVAYASTLKSMAFVWSGSNNFLHGFLILPMSAYLIWTQRARWMSVPFKPAIAGMLLLIGTVLVWIVASLVSVQLVSQLAFVAMIGAIIWSILGTKACRELRFPLLFAFFAVPFGDFLIPILMDWTAYFTVRALQITGIPVFLEGYYFALPSGNFEVVEACSGIRFLIVGVVLGLFFAYETYKSWVKRGIFVAIAALTIIVANWVRAYLIVLVAHLTDMQYGTGRDHIYLGWFVFLLAITLLFWVGRRFEDVGDNIAAPHNVSAAPAFPDEDIDKRRNLLIAASIAMLILLSGPVFLQVESDSKYGPLPQPVLPIATGEWSGPVLPTLGYQPATSDGSEALAGQYLIESQIIELHIVFFENQQQGSELVGWRSRLFDANKWRRVKHSKVLIKRSPEDDGFEAQSVLITNGRRLLRLWQWYDVGGLVTSRDRVAKLYQAWNMITGKRRGDALVVLATPVFDREFGDDAQELEQFVGDNYVGMTKCLRPDADADSVCFSDAGDNSGHEP